MALPVAVVAIGLTLAGGKSSEAESPATVVPVLTVATESAVIRPGPRSPMAVAVIGGLITSTLFTLVVIPAVFTPMDDFQIRLLRIGKRLLPGRQASLEAETSHGA